MASGPAWCFRRMSKAEMNADPVEAEFFSAEALPGVADALVREVIQNSLDAAQTGKTVSLRFFRSDSTTSLSPDRSAAYIERLAPHLSAVSDGMSDVQDTSAPLSFLAVEDFGTTGLTGDPEQYEDAGQADDRKNDFFYFWRNVGRSKKTGEERGRWGLGKTVFQRASAIRSFFGITNRATDHRVLIMGQSVLKIHTIDELRFAPYGFYATFDDKDPDFAHPIEDTAFAAGFCADFRLSRGQEPGLSIVIPFPQDEITADEIARSVVKHYFLPVLAGVLQVETHFGGCTARLDRDTLAICVDNSNWPEKESLQRLLQLARWSIVRSHDGDVVAKPPSMAARPEWSAESFDASDLSRMREDLSEERRIAIRAPMSVKPKREQERETFFHIYLERDETLDRADEYFVRNGITLTGIQPMRQKGVRAIVVADDAPLVSFLGDAENPAHTEWQAKSEKFKGKYEYGASSLHYVVLSAEKVVAILLRPQERRDDELLRDVFYLEAQPDAAARHPEPVAKGSKRTKTSMLPVTHTDQSLRLEQLAGGFVLKPSATPPQSVTVYVAYEVRHGNPFKRYHPLDFNLASMNIETTGVTVTERLDNKLSFAVNDSDFRVAVRGFDRSRDLRVKTTVGGALS